MYSIFRFLIEDETVKLSFGKYSHYMNNKLLHSERLGLIFNYTARSILDEDALELIEVMSSSEVMNKAAEIDESLLTNVKRLTAGAFSQLIAQAKIHSIRDDFIYILDRSAYFKACMIAGGPGNHIYVYTEMVSDMSTKEALTFMEFSDAWRSIEKTPYHRDWIKKCDERLMPALHFGS